MSRRQQGTCRAIRASPVPFMSLQQSEQSSPITCSSPQTPVTPQARGLTLKHQPSARSPRSAPVLGVPGCDPFLPHLRGHLVQVYHLTSRGRQRPGHIPPLVTASCPGGLCPLSLLPSTTSDLEAGSSLQDTLSPMPAPPSTCTALPSTQQRHAVPRPR